MLRYVVYTRVSTEDQGKSGLGLEAQERDIGIFLEKFSGVPYETIGRFQDIQSGGNNDRPALAKALAMVRKTGAELLVAKLDRLSRKVSFISALMDDPKVKLRVAQMPQADKFQLHIYAALAEQERTFISERTKAALGMAKERGVKLGGMRDATMKRNAAIQVKADAEAAKVMKVIKPMTEAGASLSHVARTLQEMGIGTSRGGKWTAMQVSRVIERSRP
ncbi:resolvase/recombinase protein [Rhizobium phaseoli]|uniref:recombinase family protein n=1 Tax=Rhizobium phaseoli TaxID=396 RepID=UPI0007E98412|nr:recombinase family protein [Rhizobium phaseoli]ANL55085.1 resolvase/recombinase protein [Rhizobium phaseoli]ANL67515.1 resolvase/recombinase protein [Rhizobium phaseoli]ANL80328.1 resolvase/recombinase protein [Rhizobium phaseoli]